MDKYHNIPMSVLSSAKIKDRVRLILQHIKPANSTEDEKKPTVVALRAKLAVAGKMISIVEIVKKNIQETGGQWWQYSTLGVPSQNASTENLTTSSLSARTSDGTNSTSYRRGGPDRSKRDLMDRESFEQDEAFETMPPLDSTHVREAVSDRSCSSMIVYLASVPVPELKELYGVQTNA